jgi:hypothetical protein
VAFGLYFVPNFLELAIRTDQESAANNAVENSSHEFLFAPSTEGFNHLVRWIAEQREIQFLFGFEALQRFHGISAGTKNRDAELVELPFCVTKLGRFGGSTGGVGLGEEKNQNTLALEVAKGDFSALIGSEGEIGRFVAWLEHGVHLAGKL